MYDVTALSATIVPKSDQLNADQLLSGPMTIRVSDVTLGSEDQPVVIHYHNDGGRPFKPCKSMRKVLIFAWGEDGTKWAGKSMTLFNDQSVRFGGMDVGGIRISHMSHIKGDIEVAIMVTKGRKAKYTVKLLTDARMDDGKLQDWLQAISIAGADELDGIKAEALKAAEALQDRGAFVAISSASKRRRQALSEASAT